MRIFLLYSLDIVCFLAGAGRKAVDAECRTENKMDGMHAAVEVEACAFGSISGRGSGVVLQDTVSSSNDEVPCMALWAVDVKEAGKTDMVDAWL